MAFYIPEVVLALREMKIGNEGGGGGERTVFTTKKRGYKYDRDCIYIMNLTP